MNIHDLTALRREDLQQGLYNLFDATFAYQNTGLGEHVVKQEEEMRIDLVCYSIYQNTNQTDLLLNFNEILNPLNIMAGDVLVYPMQTNVDLFKKIPPTPPDQRDSMVTTGRSNLKDARRSEYIENNYQLPPTMLPSPVSPITVGRNEIFITPVR